jgi:hypothetical protein
MASRIRAGHADEVAARPCGGGGERLDEFLAAAQVTVVDVTRGAAAGTRRLRLGGSTSGPVSYVVAVADRPDAATAIATEARILTELGQRASPSVLATLPRVVARVSVGDRPAVVMTAPPQARPGRPLDPQDPLDRAYLGAVGGWLEALWRSAAGLSEPAVLGREAADQLLARYCGSRQLAVALGAVHRARLRVEGLRVRRTAVHGCLCPSHVQVRDSAVARVDDWGLAVASGEPLRDLGGFAVRIAGHRLPELVADRTGPAHAVRDFVRTGLDVLEVPAGRWRDVLLLAQAERAVAALEHGRTDQVERLATAADGLPPDADDPEAAR